MSDSEGSSGIRDSKRRRHDDDDDENSSDEDVKSSRMSSKQKEKGKEKEKPKGKEADSRKRDRSEKPDHWDLGQKKRVSINVFRGKTLIDIREYYEDEGELKPGKKGISLTKEQWEKLKKQMEEIDEVLETSK
jgi:hypothetical protein